MLRGLTAQQFLEWEEFCKLEPLDMYENRADWRMAAILKQIFDGNQRLVDTILAAAGAEKSKRPKFVETKLQDFLLKWNPEAEDAKPKPKKQQTWEEQLRIVQLINAAFHDPQGNA